MVERNEWQPLGWDRASTLQLRAIPKGDRAAIAFHQEHLPGAKEREERRTFFTSVLDDSYPSARKNFDAFPRSVKRGVLEWIANAKRPQTRANGEVIGLLLSPPRWIRPKLSP